MLNIGFLWLALAITSEITGTAYIKKTEHFTHKGFSMLVITAYTLCYVFLTKAMVHIPVGMTYSLLCGFGIVGVTVSSMILYKQKPDLAAVISMGIIISGSVIMNVFSMM